MTAAKETLIEWSAEGLLDEIKALDAKMKDRSLAFILGAGASVSSGIPAGGKLAQAWLNEMHLRQCLDPHHSVEAWAADQLDVPGFRLVDAATHYAKIFELRFGGDPQSGYAALEAAMEKAEPSLGYSILARILAETRHKVVVTTNFDNLVADALAIHALQHPLIVGHESLTGFVRSHSSRPLVAKIHRDLHFDPKNDRKGVDTLEEGWRKALTLLFQHCTPLVIGYGGNDGSLMGFLAELPPGHIPGRLFWCYREGERPGERILKVVARHRGVLVAIADFDLFMVQLAEVLFADFKLDGIAKGIENIGRQRAERYQAEADKLMAQLAKPESGLRSATTGKALEAVSKANQDWGKWWTWELSAQAEEDLNKRDEIYRQALKQLPKSAELTSNYAIFLQRQRKDYDAAEAMYKRALELDQNNANRTSNYAIFLDNQRKDYDAAEVMYKRALELDPNNATVTGNYAFFLANRRNDYDTAESMFKRSLGLDPNHAHHTGNYANFLKNQRKNYDAAEVMYKRAMELDPSNAHHAGSYALFLENQRKDYDAAEAMYKRALVQDMKYADVVGAYANFLAIRRNDNDAAEAMYTRAVELAPTDVNHAANFASFVLTKEGKAGTDRARKVIRRVIESAAGEPSQALGEALLYDCLISELDSGTVGQSVGRLKELLRLGYDRGNWDFSPVFDTCLPDIAAERRDFYRALGEAILDAEKVAELDRFQVWQQTQPADPFSLSE